MRKPVVCALALFLSSLLGRAAPGEAEKLLDQARALDARAEAMLDAGNRAGAFEALARAADLRERARRLRAGEDPGPAAPEPPPDARESARTALAAMEASLATGDLKAAAEEGRRAFAALSGWAAALERAPGPDVARRLAGLEAQVRDLRQLLDSRDR